MTEPENPTARLPHSTVDLDRAARTGAPEVIYGHSKTADQIIDIAKTLAAADQDILITRADAEKARRFLAAFPDARYSATAEVLTRRRSWDGPQSEHLISVVTAGTSDLSVAEEAALTCEFYDQRVQRINDVGVAGLQRLLDRLAEIRSARVVIVVAGMEGALPSVIGGLIDKPLIAVPTSVGYGASFQGLAALLGMLNSCASGMSVVNIDNGFGAGYLATMINRL
ncbi:MAG: nickel pincer cofactor biosynthesis protein LarB [Pseudomonadota bacterium]